MKSRILSSNLRLVGTVLCLFVITANALGQRMAGSDMAETGPVLIMLSTPEYPPIARMADVSGEVKVTVSITKNGVVESAEATGPALLKQAALESVLKSTFECRGCTNEAKRLLTFYFKISDEGDCCGGYGQPPEVTQLQDRIVIVAPKSCICDPAVQRSVP